MYLPSRLSRARIDQKGLVGLGQRQLDHDNDKDILIHTLNIANINPTLVWCIGEYFFYVFFKFYFLLSTLTRN